MERGNGTLAFANQMANHRNPPKRRVYPIIRMIEHRTITKHSHVDFREVLTMGATPQASFCAGSTPAPGCGGTRPRVPPLRATSPERPGRFQCARCFLRGAENHTRGACAPRTAPYAPFIRIGDGVGICKPVKYLHAQVHFLRRRTFARHPVVCGLRLD